MPVPPLEELKIMHSSLCQAVGDPKRIQILYALDDEPQHVTALAELLQTPQPTISRHLAILRQCHLVEAKRNGQVVVYQLTHPKIIEVLNMMRQILRDSLEHQSDSLGTF
jgi:ArsR family transcriptional regulator